MAANDPNFASVKLLLHCDGADDGTTFTDVTGKTVTRNNAVTKTATKKYGTASGYFDGTGDYLSVPSSSDFDFGTGDFTIECWVYQTTGSSIQSLAARWASTAGNNFSWRLLILADGTPALQYGYGSYSVGATATATAAISLNTWTHVAVACASGTIKVFLDGAVVETHTRLGTLTTSTAAVNVARHEESNVWYFTGYLDDIRITKGVARYTDTFTPPSAAFGDYDRYLAGTITEDTDHTDFVVRAHRLDTGALVTELASTGGAYEIPIMVSGAGYTGPVMLSAYQKLGTVWTANTAYASGAYVFPPDPVADPHVFKCTSAGTSHATTEPTWDTTPGNTTSDGSVTWTCQGRMVQPLLQGPLIPSI